MDHVDVAIILKDGNAFQMSFQLQSTSVIVECEKHEVLKVVQISLFGKIQQIQK